MGKNGKTPVISYKRIISVGATLIWMAVIFIYSAQNDKDSSISSGNMTHFILDALTQLGIISACNITAAEFLRAEAAIRTTAHFLEYLILGIFTYQMVRYTIAGKKLEKIIYPFIFCGLYAMTDEIHQYFVPGRAMQFTDWLVDAAGAILGICILFLATKRKKIRRS